jgi:glycosyltransferase involved in cell wall biosynthesis
LADPDFRPTISIVIPAHNCAPYLCDAVRSCLDQTETFDEIVVVDDGSDDETPGILDALAARHEAVRAVHQKNAGVSAARNRGIKEASGDYVAFLDADDLLLPHAVETYRRVLAEHPERDVVFADYWLSNLPGSRFSAHRSFGGAGTVLAFGEDRGGAALLGEEFGRAYQDSRVPRAYVCTDAILIRRALLERIGGFVTGMLVAEDYDLWGRAFCAGKVAMALGPPISEYFRWRGPSEKYEQTCLKTVRELREMAASVPAFRAEWRRLRRQMAREYLSLIYAMGVVRAPKIKLGRALAASISSWPIPSQQARYLILLLLPRPIAGALVRRFSA